MTFDYVDGEYIQEKINSEGSQKTVFIFSMLELR